MIKILRNFSYYYPDLQQTMPAPSNTPQFIFHNILTQHAIRNTMLKKSVVKLTSNKARFEFRAVSLRI